MNKYSRYILFFVLLSNLIKAQVVFLNNPSNHLVASNPAFSAICSSFNYNYIPNQITASCRVSNKQSDAMLTGQYYFFNKNTGISTHYNYVQQNKFANIYAGMGVSHHLIFFNKVSTGWGVSCNYNTVSADTNAFLNIYNEQRTGFIKNSNYLSLNFGGLINYEQIMFGFSYQPKQTVFFTSSNKGTYNSVGSICLKYKKPLTRKLNATFWYNANFNSINNLQLINNDFKTDKLQSHLFNAHLSGNKGLVFGAGFRLTNFNYTSALVKAGFNAKKWQLVYGIEPYWLHKKYSEIIHELSFTFKFK